MGKKAKKEGGKRKKKNIQTQIQETKKIQWGIWPREQGGSEIQAKYESKNCEKKIKTQREM